MQSQLLTLCPQTIDSAIHVINHGAVWLCRQGSARLGIDLDTWEVEKDTAVIFFPGDVVQWHDMTNDFQAEVIRYSPEILRSACLNMEHSIYSLLREDRMCRRPDVVEQVIKNMFRIFDFYFADNMISDVDKIVDSQLRSFFMGFNSYISNSRSGMSPQGASRTVTLFNGFMKLVKTEFLQAHEVVWFADKLNVSRKYLSVVVKKHAGVTPKKIIDEYIILQLQLTLRTTQKPMKQIASEFHFADASVMTRYFKAHTGVNPIEYRNS